MSVLKERLHVFNNLIKRSLIPLLLFLLTSLMIVIIELRHPYFFLKDDNLHEFLPFFAHNLRSLLSGEIPLFNFHQYLGTPSLSNIQSAAFYPPNYVAVLLSQVLLGNYSGTMEFLAMFHLVLAALGFFYLMRHFGLEDWSCFFGAIAWTFCGFVITVGNSWIIVLEYAACLPWILLFSLSQIEKFNINKFIILIILRVTAIFIGNPTFFIYLFTFDIFTVVVLYFIEIKNTQAECGTSYRRAFTVFLWKQACNYICAFIIAAPILLPALHQVKISAGRNSPLSWEEYSTASYNFLPWLNGLVSPLSDNYIVWPEQQFISHIGFLTLFFCIMAVWQRNNRKLVMLFISFAVFSFLWANNTFITKIIYYIPYYNRQRYPFKLVFFTSFFMITVASFGFNECYRRVKGFQKQRWKFGNILIPIILLIHIGNFITIYIVSLQRTTNCSRVQKPPHEESLKNLLKDGRIISIVSGQYLDSCATPIKPTLLGFNYATLFGLYHFAGYDNLVSVANLEASLMLQAPSYIIITAPFNPSNESIDYYRKWGVKWYVMDTNVEVIEPSFLKTAYSDDERKIMLDSNARPFVYWLESANKSDIIWDFTTNSIFIKTRSDGVGEIIVNVLYNSFFNATIDGKKVEINKTEDKQMSIVVPSGPHEINVTYIDPYFYNGCYISVGFLILSSVWGLWQLKRKSLIKFV